MGLMRFLVSPADRISEAMLQQAYLSGLDRIPSRARIRRREQEILFERSTADSCALNVPWAVEDYGQLVLTTGTLRERDEPYHLPLELARGKVGQVRNQLADWQAIGLVVPPAVVEKLQEATRALAEAVVQPPESTPSVEQAEKAIAKGIEAGSMLVAAYTEQAIAVRRRMASKWRTLLGADLGLSPLDDFSAGRFLESFNAANVPILWRDTETSEGSYAWAVTDKQIEWCRSSGLAVCAGPLVQLDQGSIPDWLYVCEDDFESVLDFACEFVQAAVTRYRGKVKVWQCAGRINTGTALSLADDDKMKLAARTIELTRSLDPEAEIVISFDQPWAEYLGGQRQSYPPIQFADMLVRAGLGLTGLALEINVGHYPGGTLPRDAVDFGRQLDYWSMLGMPLYLVISVPGDWQPDPLAQRRTSLTPGIWSAATQRAWVSRYVPLFLAKPSVHGVIWSQLRDSEPHSFSHGGLFDARRHPKPALRQLASIRQTCLKQP
jgi:hypothetical protein